jgi:hypothetical protein
VTIKAFSLKVVTISPVKRPKTIPRRRVRRIQRLMGIFSFKRDAQNKPVKAITEPMERSIDPVININVNPEAAMAVILTCLKTLNKLREVRKTGELRAIRMLKITKTRIILFSLKKSSTFPRTFSLVMDLLFFPVPEVNTK